MSKDRGRPSVTPVCNAVLLSKKTRRKLWGDPVGRREVKAYRPPVLGLTACSGPVGSGKSLWMVSQAMTWLNGGGVVVSNLTLDLHDGTAVVPQVLMARDDDGAVVDPEGLLQERSVRVVTLLDLCELLALREEALEGGGREEWLAMPWMFCAIDEAAIEAGGRDWQNFPTALAQGATEVRKRKAVVWMTTVEWHVVDKLLKLLVGWVWHCEYVPGWDWAPESWTGGAFRLQARRPDWEQKNSDEAPQHSEVWRPERAIVDAYDTHAVVSGLRARLEIDRARQMRRALKL